MFRKPITVFNWKHITKEYYTFEKDGKWCGCDGAIIALYLPKYLGNDIQHLLKCAYSEGEIDGQFEENELRFENGDFKHNPMA